MRDRTEREPSGAGSRERRGVEARALPGKPGRAFRLGALVLLALVASRREAAAIEVEELREAFEKGERPALIDIRSGSDFARGRIPGAINVPFEVCGSRRLPPLGRVVVYGDGLDAARAARAAELLGREPGVRPEVLEGGYLRWTALGETTTGERGMVAEREPLIFYHQLDEIAATNPAVVLVDLRRGPAADGPEEGAPAAGPAGGTGTDLGGRPRLSPLGPVPDAQVSALFLPGADDGKEARVILDGGSGAADGLAGGREARRVALPAALVERLESLAGRGQKVEGQKVDVLDLRPAAPGTGEARATRRAGGTEGAEDTAGGRSATGEEAARELTELSAVFPRARVRRIARRGPPAETGRLLREAPGGREEIARALSRDKEALAFDRAEAAALIDEAKGGGQRDLYVLIDDGDGASKALGRRLRAAGIKRFVILAGGEEALRRRGKPGRERR